MGFSTIRLYVDGHFENSGTASSLLDRQPAQPLELGVDSGGSVGDYDDDNAHVGLLDEVAIYYRALSTEEIQERSLRADARSSRHPVLACSFNNNDARDDSTNGQVSRDFSLDSPPVWDGVSVAQGRIFIVTADGKIRCYGQPPKPPVLP